MTAVPPRAAISASSSPALISARIQSRSTAAIRTFSPVKSELAPKHSTRWLGASTLSDPSPDCVPIRAFSFSNCHR
jgi:hypothetical protein